MSWWDNFLDWYQNDFGSAIRNSGFGNWMSGIIDNVKEGVSNFTDHFSNSMFGNSDSSGYLQQILDYISGQSDLNSQLAAQKELLGLEQAFNSSQAQLNRDWQERMSNTAVQRQVADLKAAGLNPWLALNGGMSGASTGSGAVASSAAGSVGKRTNTWSDMVTAANKLIGSGASKMNSMASSALKIAAMVVMAMCA